MEWTLRTESSGNSLTDAHQQAFHEVADLYHYQDPHHLETFRQRAEMLEQTFPLHHRETLVSTVREYMADRGASETSMQQLERLLDKRSVAVVTGQQAGLFTGPLYALYKAMSAIGLAKRMEGELGRPVVPVFWIASEDHDWGEVNHAYVLDTEDEVQKIRLKEEPPIHQMVYHTPVSHSDVAAVVNQVNRALPDGSFKQEVLDFVLQSHTDGMSLADWFAKLLWKMVEPHGLVIVDPCLPGLRRLVGSVWTKTLQNLDALQDELGQAYAALEKRGYVPLVVRDPANSTVFYVENGNRFVLEKVEDGLRARGLGTEQPVEHWVHRAEREPENFSSNVLLRPVVQDTMIPTLTYVGGPAELSYHALAGAVFRIHGRTLPPLMLRHRVRVFTPSVRRHMSKWGLGEADVARPLEVSQWLRHRVEGTKLEEAFAALKSDTEVRWRNWAEQFTSLGPQIEHMASRQRERESAQIDRLQRKTERLFALNHEVDIRQLQHINRWLWTNGTLQERRLSPLNLWTKYGLNWLIESPMWSESPAQLRTFDVFI